MSPIIVVRDTQISSALNGVTDYSLFINSSATFTKSGSHPLTASIAKGMEFDETISISNGIVEQYDNFTFKFNTPDSFIGAGVLNFYIFKFLAYDILISLNFKVSLKL